MLEKFKNLNELSSMLLAHIEESGIAISDSDKRFGPGYFGFVAMVAQAIKTHTPHLLKRSHLSLSFLGAHGECSDDIYSLALLNQILGTSAQLWIYADTNKFSSEGSFLKEYWDQCEIIPKPKTAEEQLVDTILYRTRDSFPPVSANADSSNEKTLRHKLIGHETEPAIPTNFQKMSLKNRDIVFLVDPGFAFDGKREIPEHYLSMRNYVEEGQIILGSTYGFSDPRKDHGFLNDRMLGVVSLEMSEITPNPFKQVDKDLYTVHLETPRRAETNTFYYSETWKLRLRENHPTSIGDYRRIKAAFGFSARTIETEYNDLLDMTNWFDEFTDEHDITPSFDVEKQTKRLSFFSYDLLHKQYDHIIRLSGDLVVNIRHGKLLWYRNGTFYRVQNPYGGIAEPVRLPTNKPEIIKRCPSLLMRFVDDVINNNDLCALLIESQIKEDQERKARLRSEDEFDELRAITYGTSDDAEQSVEDGKPSEFDKDGNPLASKEDYL
ncbi:hypothetical protein [Marinomonas communis]|uniref:hypothetical protein n=1 Tax=Marinomonas communis TaxID=28254 RepID=UPI001D1834B8|nr:hypothetical protein [Marinomonas communis]MCC4273918.1 hypothetical protein [Marinomonas communis]